MEFKEQLKEMQAIISEKKWLSVLATRSGVEVRTVYNTFNAESYDEIKGARLKVYKEAIKMVDEIKSLPAQSAEVLSKQP